MPFVASAAATGILATFVFNPQFGVANDVLRRLAPAAAAVPGEPHQALVVICLIALWGEVGFTAVIYLAALQDIPQRAGRGGRRSTVPAGWQVFRHVTLPELRAGHRVRRGLADDHRAAAVRPRLHDHPRRPAAVAPRRSSTTSTSWPSRPSASATARPSRTGCSPSRCCSPLGIVWYAPAREGGGVLMATVRSADARRPAAAAAPRRSAAVQPAGTCCSCRWRCSSCCRSCRWSSTSFMTDADINRFPPQFIPTALHVAGYVGLFSESHILRWLLNTIIVVDDRGRRAPRALLAGRLRLRPAASSPAATSASS